MARKPVIDMSAWPSLTLEGNLIAAAMVASIDRRQASDQAEEDYRIRKGLTIREEISTSFRVGQSHFDAFAKLQNPSVESTRRYVRAFLAETFGFDDLVPTDATISFLAGGRVPVVVVPPSEEKLDRRSPTLSTDRSRSPAFALQDYLNDQDDALWGLVTNGTVLRLMRDNASLTRPAYIEADLAQIFTNEDAASFAVLWSLIHRTRFGAIGAPATDCALERWREAGSREGEAARDRLAAQVEIALRVLGSGFLDANPDLATRLKSGEIDLTEWFNELLRLVYRLIFLMVAEDRTLLHPETATQDARKLYREGYSLAALRASCVRAATWDKHHDRYEGVKIVFRALAHGQDALGLPALGGLFADDKLPHLETARLRNRAFMEALYRLSWLSDKTGMTPVNWRVMETEELGSVYESLLELQPQLGEDGKTLLFASETAEQKGNQRKTTGSYYTPDSLVQALLDTALDPVLDKTEAEADDPAAALLNLSVIDPACGSGHFLLAAARRIATRVARIRADGTPSLSDFRHALRDVARSCLHGVDRNPMAVELTKVALWIETVDPGLPLGFFDAQIRCGDALLGVFDLKALGDGIPDAAYKLLTGDDKDTAKYYARANRDEKAGQGTLDFTGGRSRLPAIRPIATEYTGFRALSEDSLDDIVTKDRRFRSIRESEAFHKVEMACDLYIAAFLLPKTGGAPTSRGTRLVPTTSDVWQALDDGQVWGPIIGQATVARRARAFHWPLEFPDVMQQGGFDVVLGNPPWEVIQFSDEEFFSGAAPEVAILPGAKRKKAIALLEATNPTLWNRYRALLRGVEGTKEFVKSSGRFSMTAFGKLNLYALFAELAMRLANDSGRSGVIVQSGIATDEGNKHFFDHLVSKKMLVCLYDFENREKLFPIDSRMKFAILVLGKDSPQADFVFFATNTIHINEYERRFRLSADDITLINPNTRTCPVFRSKTDAELTKSIYRKSGSFINTNASAENGWRAELIRILNLTDDSHLFQTREDLLHIGAEPKASMWFAKDGTNFLPLYEPKMIHHYDHRWASYDAQNQAFYDVSEDDHRSPELFALPRWWVESKYIDEWLVDRNWTAKWLFGWRDTTNATNERTAIATVFPVCAVGNNIPLIILHKSHKPRDYAVLLSNMSSIPFDYAARQKVGGTHLNYFLMEQLPVLPLSSYSQADFDFVVSRVVELTYNSHSMAPFARDLDHDGPPFAWDEDRRAHLRAELDAFYARAYGLTRDELRYILDPADVKGSDYPSETFRVLKDKEIRQHGEYRTQRLVLAAWDRMETDGTFRELGRFGAPVAEASPIVVNLPPLKDLPAGAWSWPSSVQPRDRLRYAAQYALWLMDSAVDTSHARFLIASLSEPALLTPMLTGSDRDQWIRLVGSEAQPANGVVRLRPAINQAWRSTFETLITSGQLAEHSNGAWARGQHFSTAGLDANSIHAQRAAFAMRAVRGMEIGKLNAAVAQEDNVIWLRFGHG
ncbi:N-6 DNA methylase [Xanthobacter autotrophicus]|uniref:Eco57I restriction-modification methylase domain-containing protein n=1 Tax=Xanthobacter autotrophicus TaxID=280 RepID=UPI00372AC4CF